MFLKDDILKVIYSNVSQFAPISLCVLSYHAIQGIGLTDNNMSVVFVSLYIYARYKQAHEIYEWHAYKYRERYCKVFSCENYTSERYKLSDSIRVEWRRNIFGMRRMMALVELKMEWCNFHNIA